MKWRSPTVLTIIGVTATVAVALMVVITLLLTGGSSAVSDNAALIGALVALGGVFTTQMVNSALEDRRAQQARDTEQGQRQRELMLASQRAQDEALQVYLDQMGQLLVDKDLPLHRAQPGDTQSTVARARTLTALPRLDGHRKASVMQFLYEAALIYKDRALVDLTGADLREVYLRGAPLLDADLGKANLRVADLSKAHLNKANLSGAYLGEADLREAYLNEANLFEADLRMANLREAYLIGADLRMANLFEANLINANFTNANLREVYLRNADLSKAFLGTDLSKADLRGANLVEAKLPGANLSEVNLSEADLSAADLIGASGWTEEQLRATKSLEGATMPDGPTLKSAANPDGPTFEDWLREHE